MYAGRMERPGERKRKERKKERKKGKEKERKRDRKMRKKECLLAAIVLIVDVCSSDEGCWERR